MLADQRMDAVRADQHVATQGFALLAPAGIGEMGGHAAFILDKAEQTAARAHCILAQPFDHGIIQQLLQTAAMDGELRHFEARMHAARLAPDGLSEAVHIDQLMRADGDRIEHRQQAQLGQFGNGMRQRVDADTHFAHLGRLFVDSRLNPALMQHQSGGQTADAATNDNCLHATAFPATCFTLPQDRGRKIRKSTRDRQASVTNTRRSSRGHRDGRGWSCPDHGTDVPMCAPETSRSPDRV